MLILLACRIISYRQTAEALKKLIIQTLNGEKYAPTMAIHVIKYLLPSQDHIIKKLLLIYWEIVPKVDEEGNLRQEMILVCDAYRFIDFEIL